MSSETMSRRFVGNVTIDSEVLRTERLFGPGIRIHLMCSGFEYLAKFENTAGQPRVVTESGTMGLGSMIMAIFFFRFPVLLSYRGTLSMLF